MRASRVVNDPESGFKLQCHLANVSSIFSRALDIGLGASEQKAMDHQPRGGGTGANQIHAAASFPTAAEAAAASAAALPTSSVPSASPKPFPALPSASFTSASVATSAAAAQPAPSHLPATITAVTSKYRGPSWRHDTRRWESRSRYNGKQLSLGCFDTEEDAARAYDRMVVGPARYWPHCYQPISLCCLSEMPKLSCGQSVSAPRETAGARLNAHTELRTQRQRSAREAIY